MSMFKHAWRMAALTGISAASLIVAAPALANPPPPPTSDGLCASSLSIPTPDAIACAGYYTGNILNGSPTDITAQTNALASLGFTWNGDWASMDASTSPDLVITALSNGNQLNFGETLFGTVIIGAHFGNGNDVIGNSSVFWMFDLGTTGASYITLDNTQGWSNAALYENGTPPGVPEPSTWAMMLLGFGAAGIAIRRSRRRNVLVTQLA